MRDLARRLPRRAVSTPAWARSPERLRRTSLVPPPKKRIGGRALRDHEQLIEELAEIQAWLGRRPDCRASPTARSRTSAGRSRRSASISPRRSEIRQRPPKSMAAGFTRSAQRGMNSPDLAPAAGPASLRRGPGHFPRRGPHPAAVRRGRLPPLRGQLSPEPRTTSWPSSSWPTWRQRNRPTGATAGFVRGPGQPRCRAALRIGGRTRELRRGP